jgi:GNAT superfamily N-acetyltransferase
MMGIENVLIRPVRLADSQQVRDQCFTMNTLEEVEAGIRQSLRGATEGKEFQLVAEVNDLVIGTVTLICQPHPLQWHRAEVAGLVVGQDYQGRGIARKLVDTCREKARTLGISILEISCRAGEPAEQIYPHLGFIEYGRLPRGLVEPWGERKVFDQVYFYLAVDE